MTDSTPLVVYETPVGNVKNKHVRQLEKHKRRLKRPILSLTKLRRLYTAGLPQNAVA